MQTIGILDVQTFMTSQLGQVFDTMFSMRVSPECSAGAGQFPERVSGSVGFGGETVTGAVYLHLPAEFASVLAACMLGQPPSELSEPDVNDVVGEVTNMLTGGLKSWLCDAGTACAVSTPGIIRGSSFTIEPPPQVQRLFLPFNAGRHHFAVEVHIKFQ